MVLELEPLSLQECRCIIKRHLQLNEFKVIKTEETPISSTFHTYSLLNIRISINNSEREVRFVVKRLSNQPLIQAANKASIDIFSHEVLFQDFKNACPSFDSNFVPKHYFSKQNNLIVFEDFFGQGFDFPEVLTVGHIKLALKTLAKYHSASIGFEHVKSKKLEKKFKLTDEYSIFQNRKGNCWLETEIEILNVLIDLLSASGLSEDCIQSLHKILKNSLETELKNKFLHVLCHGFTCSQNILFKCNGAQIPIDCKLMNFEFQVYKPPAFDVLQLIYFSTTQEVRKHNLLALLEFYYSCLKADLEAEDLDADSILSLDNFEKSIHYLLPVIKIQALCFPQDLRLKFFQGLSTDTLPEKLFVESGDNYQKLTPESILELKLLVNNPKLSIEDCFKIIQNKIGTSNYHLLDYQVTPLGGMCGYLGDHNKLKIEISVENENQTLHLFAKFMPKTTAAVEIAMDIGAFTKEIFIYQHFIPLVQDLGINIISDCGVPCYFTRRDDLIFEDFQYRNYKTLDSRQPLTYKTAAIVVRKLAKFHASSIIVEEKLSQKTKSTYRLNDHYQKELQEGQFCNPEINKSAKCIKVGIDAVQHELDLFPDGNSTVSPDTMNIKIKKAYEKIYELVKPSKVFRNVICHGDLWTNNLLIQFTDEEPTDCRFIDYQLCRYCPPAHDLLLFIYITTTRNYRNKHFKELINLYYDEFSMHLMDYGCDVEQIYSYNCFLNSIEYMIPQAVCQTVFYFQLCLFDENISKEYLSTEESVQKVLLNDRRDFITAFAKRDPLAKERVAESIQDLREMCLKYF